MDLTTILDICKEYNRLGWAVQEQLEKVIDDSDNIKEMVEDGKLNPNALKYIKTFLENIADLTGDETGEVELILEMM
jgi:hypothetical protein